MGKNWRNCGKMRLCENCGVEFLATYQKLYGAKTKGTGRVFCCMKCYATYLKNVIWKDPLFKEKIIESRKIEKIDGKKRSKDTSEKAKVRKKIWADIKRFGKVMIRTECEKCGATEKLVVHHKDRTSTRKNGYANNEPENLIVLCRACHINEHRNDLKNNINYA